MSDSTAPLRVAIVGCGPKGLYALERLLSLARADVQPGALAVDVFEPHPAPGAGPNYDPGQPEYLRMNFAAEMVDMWQSGRPDPDRLSFTEWRRNRDDVSQEAYPPRAHVGRYLLDGFRKIQTSAPGQVLLTMRAEAVSAVRKSPGGWCVAASTEREYDEILIATGHASDWDGALAKAPPFGLDVIPAVFPVETNLSQEKVPPGSVVSIRGFALTMIDASLALTEGRGGTFRKEPGPLALAYEGGPGDVERILPYSRTGRPMLAKPDPARALSSTELDTIAADGRAALAATQEGSRLNLAAAVVVDVAERSLRSVGGGQDEVGVVGPRVANAIEGRSTSTDRSPVEEIERSIEVGVGVGEPGADWALGHAWRALYPVLVDRLGARGLTDEEWPAFRHLAAEMERVSFGPPPVNAAKLLALIKCGKVDLSGLNDGPSGEASVVIDAVIPPPGALSAGDLLLRSLVDQGHATVPPARRGVELTPDVTCVGLRGKPSHGLGAIGRPTEDWVIGNDTLNRSLHPQAEIWARRVVLRAASR